MERRCPYPRRSAGRACRQAAPANPQKSADAIVAETLKLVGLGEGQNLTKRATTLDYPMKEERQKTQESCPQNDSAERESYEGAQTLIGMVGDDLVEVPTTLTERTYKSRLTRGVVASTRWMCMKQVPGTCFTMIFPIHTLVLHTSFP